MATSIAYLKEALKNPNIQAAMSLVRFTEGTTAKDGYQYMFGSSPKNDRRFTDFSTHPNQRFPFKQTDGKTNYSSAAGAYQILYGTYVNMSKKYGINGFDPLTQDVLFACLLDDAGILNAVMSGKILQEPIMKKMSSIWASLPLSGYPQPKHSMAVVRTKYFDYGGNVV